VAHALLCAAFALMRTLILAGSVVPIEVAHAWPSLRSRGQNDLTGRRLQLHAGLSERISEPAKRNTVASLAQNGLMWAGPPLAG